MARDRIEPNNSATEEEIQEYLDNGIVFAVPIKRMDMTGSLYDDSNFHALYGTTNTGWTLMTSDISDKSSVLEAAKNMTRVMQESRQTGTIVAERNARQLFQVTITNIPGDVKLTYPYLLGTDRRMKVSIILLFTSLPMQRLWTILQIQTALSVFLLLPQREIALNDSMLLSFTFQHLQSGTGTEDELLRPAPCRCGIYDVSDLFLSAT